MAPDVDAYAAAVSGRALDLRCRGGLLTLRSAAAVFDYNYRITAAHDTTYNLWRSIRQGWISLWSRVPADDGSDNTFRPFSVLNTFKLPAPAALTIVDRAFDGTDTPIPDGSTLKIFVARDGAIGVGSWSFDITTLETRGTASRFGRRPFYVVTVSNPVLEDAEALDADLNVILRVETPVPIPATAFDFWGRIEPESPGSVLEIDSDGNATEVQTIELVCRYNGGHLVGRYVEITTDPDHNYLITSIDEIGRRKWQRLTLKRLFTA